MDQALAMVYRQRELNFPPGSAYLYSNSGFLLAAEIVRRVSGKPLAEFSQETFFKPLGMTHTQWRDDWNRVVPGRVTAYARSDNGTLRVDMPFMSVYGAGGLLTTVGDLLRWNEHLTHPTNGGQEWGGLMQRRGLLSGGNEITYASGLSVTAYRGEREISHSGSSGGYETFLARWPDRELSVAVMCNLADIGPTTLARRVADVFIGLDGAAASRPTVPASAVDTTQATGPVPAAELAGLVGTYYSEELDMSYHFAASDGRLTVQLGERAPISLRRVSRDEFVATLMNLQFKFSRARNGVASGYLLSARRVQNIRFARR